MTMKGTTTATKGMITITTINRYLNYILDLNCSRKRTSFS